MRVVLALLLCLLTLPAAAHGTKAGDIEVQHLWARATIGNLRVTAGYMTLQNHGQEADRLIAAESPRAEMIELHTVIDGAMQRVDFVEIPAGGEVVFAPGGYHLMIGPIEGALNEGERLPGTLVFEKAGRVEVEFVVEAANATESHDHHH